MRQYFQNHKVIEYRGQKLRNLMSSARLTKDAIMKSQQLYPYTLDEGETPTMLAHDYYGDISYVWLIFLANDIIDPVSSWYKSQSDFDAYLVKEYGSVEYALSTVDHYIQTTQTPVDSLISVFKVSVETYQHATLQERSLLSPVSIYDTKWHLNDNKRNIKLIDRSQAQKLSLDIERLLK